MCDACFRFVVAGAPICVRCAHERATRHQRRVSLGVFTGLASIGLAGLLGIRFGNTELSLPIAIATGFLGVACGLLLALAGAKHAREQEPVQRREDVMSRAPSRVPRVRVARARRAVAALSPGISAQTTAMAVLAAMIFSIVSFPALLHLPGWLELEIVLAIWWLAGTLALCALLYRGYSIVDDHFFQAPRIPRVRSAADTIGDVSGCDLGCSDGCDEVVALIGLALAAALLVACSFFVAWLLVELALPLVFLVFYSAVLLVLRRASRDRHDCRGRIFTSLRWAVTWSSLYFTPIAGLVWALHRILPGLR
jgi:hypothetical protein